MPSKSPKQAKLMNAAAHDPRFAKKVGIPVAIAREFHEADKALGRSYPFEDVRTKSHGKNELSRRHFRE